MNYKNNKGLQKQNRNKLKIKYYKIKKLLKS